MAADRTEKVFIVTDDAQDIGAATATTEEHCGMNVVVTDLCQDITATSAEEIRASGGEAIMRRAGSSVFRVFDGTAAIAVGDFAWSVEGGDMFVVPFSDRADTGQDGSDSRSLDLFRFRDSPNFGKLDLYHAEVAQ